MDRHSSSKCNAARNYVRCAAKSKTVPIDQAYTFATLIAFGVRTKTVATDVPYTDIKT